jgi:hypothetical protein
MSSEISKGENPKKPTEEEELRQRRRKQWRDWYERNKHWHLEEQRARRAAQKPRRPARKRRKAPPRRLSAKRLREVRAASAERALAARMAKLAEWRELGWIVAKMNIHAKMSQEQIYAVLGGLATKKQISAWCAAGKKRAKLEPPHKTNAKRSSKSRGHSDQEPG